MKRFTALAIAAAIAVCALLSACGEASQPKNEVTAPAKSATAVDPQPAEKQEQTQPAKADNNDNSADIDASENDAVQEEKKKEPEEPQLKEITRELVSDSISDISYDTTEKSRYIQDLYSFCEGSLELNKTDDSGEYTVTDFTGKKDSLEVIRKYVDTICNGNYNLKKTVEYEKGYDNGSSFFSWGIDYVGGGKVRETSGVNYTDETANITMYGFIERDKLTFALWIPQSMDIVDMGLRYSGGTKEVGLGGISATAGLYRLSDGTYETSDGRLGAAPGTATVICDGESYSATAEYIRNTESSRDELWVRSFQRDNGFFLCTPIDRVQTGDVFTLEDMTRTESWVNRGNNEFSTLNDFGNYNWTQFFGAAHDGKFVTPLMRENTMFEDLTVRIMYYKKGEVCVYYIYAEFWDEPYEYEALCVANLNEDGFTGADYNYTVKKGDTIKLPLNRYFGANSEQFEWEVVEGSDLVSLSGTISSSCEVTALETGIARIRVKYEYSYDKPDVLTGNKGYGFSTKTYDYYIEIK